MKYGGNDLLQYFYYKNNGKEFILKPNRQPGIGQLRNLNNFIKMFTTLCYIVEHKKTYHKLSTIVIPYFSMALHRCSIIFILAILCILFKNLNKKCVLQVHGKRGSLQAIHQLLHPCTGNFTYNILLFDYLIKVVTNTHTPKSVCDFLQNIFTEVLMQLGNVFF